MRAHPENDPRAEPVVTGTAHPRWLRRDLLAKEGHDGLIGINCLEKNQLSTPCTLYGAMLAGVDVVLMGAGVPRAIPHLLDTLAVHGDVRFTIDVADAGETDYSLAFEPRDLATSDNAPLSRPILLAIVSAHVLAT